MSYQPFARYYDALTQNVGYEEQAEYIGRVLRRLKHSPGRALDLACGTGSLTLELAKRGINIFALDASDDMLTVAQQKAAEAGFRILFIHQKMQKMALLTKVDTVICTLDGLNHLRNEKEVEETFRRVSLYLNPGGVFLFDVNTPYKHRCVLADRTFVLDTENVYCVWQNEYDEKSSHVTITLDFFEKSGENWIRSGERFQERAYDTEVLISLLSKAGLQVRGIWKDRTFVKPGEKAEKLFIAAQKQ